MMVAQVCGLEYVEEDRLDLDRPLYHYLPYQDLEHDERYKEITARMVLSHRSGLPNWRDNDGKGLLRVNFEPGTKYGYSGEGYQYLAMVLKHIEGSDWEGLETSFQNKVAKPLGLKHTVFMQTPYTRGNKAKPYDEKRVLVDPKNNLYWVERINREFGAPYSIHSEPLDFSKWMIAVMTEKLLREETYKELLKPHSEISSGDEKLYYTLGFFHFKAPDTQTNIIAHSGNNMGFTCFFLLAPEKDWGYVVFTNSEKGEQLGNEIFDHLSVLK